MTDRGIYGFNAEDESFGRFFSNPDSKGVES